MKNGPELWDQILGAVSATYGRDGVVDGVVAGGCVRDYLLGFEPKDIDVFVPYGGTPAVVSDDRFERLEVPEGRAEEYEGKSWVKYVDDYRFEGINVQVILVEIGADGFGQRLVDTFDIGLTRCWYDGEVRTTDEFLHDAEGRTLTVLLRDRIDRTYARAKRFQQRHPDFLLVDLGEGSAAA